MTSDFWDIVRREAQAAVQPQRSATLIVTSYDPKTHSVKGTLKPYGIESGWIPVGTQAVGDGFGIAVGPCVGDQFNIHFENGDQNSPRATHRLFSNDAKPPKVESGEVVIWSKFKHKITLTKDGKMVIEAEGDTKFNVTKGKCDVTVKGDTTIKTDGKAHVESKGDMSVKSSGNLNVESTGTTNIKSTGGMTVQGGPLNLVGTA